ncbi:hypothetical protein GobsT_12920 [Gemmata obscuriglobus]|uniref:DUF1800 domain-containing protein n=1 Tax=Gemmata obscuriglobus TaxID=114 RepID=A0A2Z3H5R7_9BACT|nr:DUF1800 domain-containing protein [Gemmata obscuriglobus]AWM40251.1 DUF1800 domain-containing protein [Gemmata obscuriglobus]QEG26551.1 hypothetical protein GobsT_12920 [Gemmata obscuriglobus]VTS01940.1 Uncharacterized protein OS=Singulisphaera acidiphila (strain ATCC BAA-1392 / DSM 18658 / VKM B-2454 / MOB10) GN=Sinac_7200 PE=4 SV=1: DUF1800 [Gemmata obscuriglobus UQM 2246]
MSENPWAPYVPDGKHPWDLARVVHLHRRAAFAGTWGELQRDLKDGPEKAVRRLLDGTANARPAADYDHTARLLFDAAESQGDIGRLKAGWFYRFLFGPHPLREKLTLLWHDHFATANSKVADAGLMRRQNEALRQHAAGPFAALLNAAVREPALLLYLDAPTNRKGHANENLGRELLELFTLGVGNYSEADVKEAARALTGWSVDEGRFVEVPERHDGGVKTVLGRTAEFDGAALVNLLLKHPAVADRIVAKLVRQFFGEGGVPTDAAKQLAAGLRERELDVGWAVETVLRSRLFSAEANIRTRVLMPVEFVVGAARALELFDPPPSTLAMADWSARMGQDVFDPPNVGGWPVGRKWVHARSLIARSNYAAALVTGPHSGRSEPYDPAAGAKARGFDDVLTFHHRLLFGTDPSAEMRARLGKLAPPKLVIALLSSPEAQLG